jgi:CheY-like chemotaxis protein
MAPLLQVLVVDDDAATRTLFRAVLERQGLTVTLAADGDEALELLAAESFDAILLDLVMPGTDGVAVLRHLMLRSPESLQRVVVATAVPAARLDPIPELQSVAAVLTKPLEIHCLTTEILACVAASVVDRDVREASLDARRAN